MKKFFTLIAAVAMAASMNAQGTYAVQVGDNVKAGDKITSVENITLTYMENDGTAYAAVKKQTNWADADFGAYVCGKNNGKLVSGAEPTGCVYKFDTAKAGSLTVGVQLNGNKGFHILDAEFAEVAPASYNLPAKDGDSQKFEQNEKGENIIAEKSNGTVTFSVAEGGTYYVLAAGTTVGTFLGWLLLAEPVTLYFWIGFTLIAVGVVLALRGGNTTAAEKLARCHQDSGKASYPGGA